MYKKFSVSCRVHFDEKAKAENDRGDKKVTAEMTEILIPDKIKRNDRSEQDLDTFNEAGHYGLRSDKRELSHR